MAKLKLKHKRSLRKAQVNIDVEKLKNEPIKQAFQNHPGKRSEALREEGSGAEDQIWFEIDSRGTSYGSGS